MPPKRRNRKGDDDDFFAGLAREEPSPAPQDEVAVSVSEPTEEAPKAKKNVDDGDASGTSSKKDLKKKEKGKGKQDETQVATAAPAEGGKPKKDKKKGRRKGDSDSEDDIAPNSSATLAPVIEKKKKKAKGRKGDDSSESDDGPAATAAKEAVAPAATGKKEKKKKVAGGKSRKEKQSDSDSEDPLAIMKKYAEMSSDDASDPEQAADAAPKKGQKSAQTGPDVDTTQLPLKAVDVSAPAPAEIPKESPAAVAADTVADEQATAQKSKARMSKAERKKSKHQGASSTVVPLQSEVHLGDIPAVIPVSTEDGEMEPNSKSDPLVGGETGPNTETAAPAASEANEASGPIKTEAAPAKAVSTAPAKKSKLELKLAAAKKEKELAEASRKEREQSAPAESKMSSSFSKLSISGNSITEASKIELAAAGDAKLASTLFGDDVFSENPAHKKEIKYDAAALKASAEGNQFAVSQSTVNVNDPQWQNALDVIIPNFSISAHNKELFYNSELNIAHGRRYGLVGPNGAGKSTLLKMISAGELKVPPRVDYLYVEQEVLADDTRAVDAVLKADKERWSLIEEEQQLLSELATKADDEKDVRLGEIYSRLENIGAAAAEGKARRILFGLGFDAEMQIRPTQYFSGGWRMRIALARALFMEPTLLMLDEPTNHLDLNAVIWLDDYLQKWKKTLLIVSHDQDFLNSVCDEILHLEDKKLFYYKGNYDSFKEQEATVRKQRQKEWEKQERKLRELKSKGQSKAGAEKAVVKSKSREPGARAAKKAEAANLTSGIESAETKIELLKRPREYTVEFSFPTVAMVSPPILEVRDVTFAYGPKLPILFNKLNFGLDMSSRVCIVGPNGSGKSTILKLITGEINPPIGEVRRNPRLRVGVYNQHFMDRLPMDEDPVTYLRRMFNDQTYQSCRNILGRYGLEGHAHTIPIRDLSGGQKARVVFVELSLMAPHLLFLDEPTNNLDIESIDALCDALKQYNGGVVLVSHDARLIETTECQLWVVEDQNVTPWESGFSGYRSYLLQKLEEQMSIIIAGSGERPV